MVLMSEMGDQFKGRFRLTASDSPANLSGGYERGVRCSCLSAAKLLNSSGFRNTLVDQQQQDMYKRPG